MSDKTVELKSKAFAEKHNLESLITLDDKGLFNKVDDLFETAVLMDAGITLDQYKKLEKGQDQLLNASILVGGQKFAEACKTNNELTESSFSYNMGNNTVATVLFNRDEKAHVVAAVETRVKSAEHKRVLAYVDQLFDEINS